MTSALYSYGESIFMKMSLFQSFALIVTCGLSMGHCLSPEESPFHPSVVRILYHDREACDGSILSESIILTAAHCILGYWHKKVKVLVSNVQDISIHNVTSIKYHKNYHPISGTSDIALLKLKDRIAVRPGIVFTRLPKERVPLVSEDSQSLAYRWTEPGRFKKNWLLTASIDTVIPLEECAKSYNKSIKSLEGLFCARSGRLKIIREMTGGPVVVNKQQVGIVTSQRPLGLEPVLFMDVTFFLSWINETEQRMTICNQTSTSFYPLPKEVLDSNAKYRGEIVPEGKNMSSVAIVNAKSGKLMCVGSIVAPDLVLTTARCVKKRWKHMTVRVISRNNVNGSEVHTIVRAYKHRDFDRTSLLHGYDVALLRVQPIFNFDHPIQEIGVYDREEKIQPLMTGWVYGPIGTPDMRRLDALVIDHKECNWIYRKRGGVDNGAICALTYHGMCNHAEGEPFIIGDQLVGILTAPLEECGDFRYPAVFINVTADFHWIKSKISRSREKRSEEEDELE